MENIVSLSTPAEFNAFPYKPPYSIQVDLMRHLYAAIENRKLVVIESPTGTGKTLSLLCASLTWLGDDKIRSRKGQLVNLRNSLNSGDDPEWVITQSFERIKNELETTEREFGEHLAKLRKKEQALRKREGARVTKRPRLDNRVERNEDPDDSFLPDNSLDDHHVGFTDSETLLSDERFERLPWYPSSSKSPAISARTKIFYASRTHSQLSQVIHELVKLKLISASTTANFRTSDRDLDKNVEISEYTPRTVALASRAHLCINDQLRARATDLDQACRDQLTGPPEGRCPYLPPLGDENRMRELRDRILADPIDMEDLVLTGKDSKTCPYFGCRSAVQSAELVTLPYSLLLHKRTRTILDIDLTDQVIIIDEAHNLIDAILQLHSIELSTSLLLLAISQLQAYLERFRTQLNAIHALHLKRLILFLTALDQFVSARVAETEEKQSKSNFEEVLSVSTFMESMGSKVNGINLLELQGYLINSKIARKVCGYAKKKEDKEKDHDRPDRIESKTSLLPLHAVEAFISSLTNDVKDGIITLCRDNRTREETHIKYQHLNPSTYFNEILKSARCVVLAGGTMSPISDVAMQLFPAISEDHISVFSCGHVIPRSNLQCLVIGKGPRGKELEYKFKDRSSQFILDELGQILFNLVNVVPHGMVVFFPSYSFLDSVRSLWVKNGLLGKLRRKKQIFYEPSESSEVENILREYSLASAMASGPSKGALLFAVVGAKLSEGLNFADELARAVVLVGLPYPNLASPGLKERMKYVTELAKNKSSGFQASKNAGNELYENLCMRAVNQSIGRAIRHQKDWSSLILIDNRYRSEKVRNKMPGWINQNIIVTQSFGHAIKLLGDFYRAKR